jgi:hypothetical protein
MSSLERRKIDTGEDRRDLKAGPSVAYRSDSPAPLSSETKFNTPADSAFAPFPLIIRCLIFNRVSLAARQCHNRNWFPGDPQGASQRRANPVLIALLHLVLESRTPWGWSSFCQMRVLYHAPAHRALSRRPHPFTHVHARARETKREFPPTRTLWGRIFEPSLRLSWVIWPGALSFGNNMTALFASRFSVGASGSLILLLFRFGRVFGGQLL